MYKILEDEIGRSSVSSVIKKYKNVTMGISIRYISISIVQAINILCVVQKFSLFIETLIEITEWSYIFNKKSETINLLKLSLDPHTQPLSRFTTPSHIPAHQIVN